RHEHVHVDSGPWGGVEPERDGAADGVGNAALLECVGEIAGYLGGAPVFSHRARRGGDGAARGWTGEPGRSGGGERPGPASQRASASPRDTPARRRGRAPRPGDRERRQHPAASATDGCPPCASLYPPNRITTTSRLVCRPIIDRPGCVPQGAGLECFVPNLP